MACSDSATAYCTKLGSCSQIAISADYGDSATCVTRQTTLCTNGLMAPGTGNTPTTVEACVAAYPSWSCADFTDSVPPAACQPPPGAGGMGAVCAFDAQCSSAFCQIPSCVNYDATTGAAGTCVTSVAEAGAPCDHSEKMDAGCASALDLYCAKDGTCQPYMCVGTPVDGGVDGTCVLASASACQGNDP